MRRLMSALLRLLGLSLVLLYGAFPAEARLSRKLGTGFYFEHVDDLIALRNLTWWYNWGTQPSQTAQEYGLAHGLEFVPMQWANWGIEELAKSPSLEKATTLLGFNEPNHRGQANLEPEDAAALWPFLEEAAQQFGLRLGSPSAAPCGVDCVMRDPFKWWDAFFAACKDCRVDFLAVHIYSCNADAIAWFLKECKRYKLPVWVTEFACPIGPGPHGISQEVFMAAAVQTMERDVDVERCSDNIQYCSAVHFYRYAWFAPRVDDGWVGASASLLHPSKPVLTHLGKLYMGQEQRGQPGEIKAVSSAQNASSWNSQCGVCSSPGVVQACFSQPGVKWEDQNCAHCAATCGYWTRHRDSLNAL